MTTRKSGRILSIGSAGLPKNAWRQSMPSDVNIMEIHTDFKELLELFSVSAVRHPFRESPWDNKHKVEYIIISLPMSLATMGNPVYEIL